MAENNEQENVEKSFGLTTLSLNNKTTVYVLTALIVLLGISTYLNLPKESFPEIKQPKVYVGTAYPGNSPVDIENLVTRQLEKELNTVKDVEEIVSTSVQDYSTIIVEFSSKVDLSEAVTKVKDAVDKAKQDLPTDLPADPNIFEMDFSEFPILNVNLSGDFSIKDLNNYAEYLEDEIEKLKEISKVDIRGVDDKEVKVMCDPYQMAARQVSFRDIEEAIGYENQTVSSGNIKEGGMRRSLRVVGQFETPAELLDVVVKSENGNIVYLKEVANVAFGYKEKQNYARLDNKTVVMLDVVKRSGENLLIATDKINAIIEKAREEVLPKNLQISITNDQSEDTRNLVSSLENNIISGVLLVVLVLLFFLGTRNSLFVGVAIPLSMFMSFLILGMFGITINMIVLFSLIMALGMLVDNGIVVVENVYRLMEEGYSPYEATKTGVGEVALPIIASTATTLAAFLPLAFWPGIMGEFMKYLPITLMVTLGSSLFVALVINPVLIASFMRVGKQEVNHKRIIIVSTIVAVLGIALLIAGKMALGNLLIAFAALALLNVYVLTPASNAFQSTFLPWLENLYSNLLSFSLKGRNSYLFFWGTVGLLGGAIGWMVADLPKIEYFPIGDPKYVNVFVEFPLGTDVETTNKFANDIEKKVIHLMKPYDEVVKSVTCNVGEGASDPGDPSSFGQTETPNKARITVNFVEFKLRGKFSTKKIMEEIREKMKGYPGVNVTVAQNADGPPAGKPINIEITGSKLQKLLSIAENMKGKINQSGIEGIEKLKIDIETGKPELTVNIDREKARRFNLSTGQIAGELRTALFGKEVSKFKQGEDEYEIQLRLKDKFRYDLGTLMDHTITFRNQSNGRIHQVPISAVAKADLSSTFGSIKRKDLFRVVTITSNVEGGANANEINAEIKELLADYEMPTGYSFKFGGEQQKQAEEMSFLSGALMMAVFLIFIIIVAQFNKLTAPFIIMMSVLLSTIGVILGLKIFNMTFVVIMTMIGIISLAGIVVNNAIVLIDFIELSRERKRKLLGVDMLPMEEILDSIVMAGKTRLRPVLLTAITTVLGLIPLAIGINIDFVKFFNEYNADFYLGGDNVMFWGPMSWTIIFGLTFATFLTLVIVPTMYLFFAKLNRWLKIS